MTDTPGITDEGIKSMTDPRLKVCDMVISDEFILVPKDVDARRLAEIILQNPNEVILVKDGTKVIGKVDATSFLRAIIDGRIKVDQEPGQLMERDIMEVSESDPLEKVLPKMFEHKPHAVIVTDETGNFKGYFSPQDCRLATVKLTEYPK